MQNINCEKITIIPCTRLHAQCDYQMLALIRVRKGVPLQIYCSRWRENHSKDKIFCACEPEFNQTAPGWNQKELDPLICRVNEHFSTLKAKGD
jgi:hypothetical protein